MTAAPLVIPGVRVDRRAHSHVLQQPLATRRGGIMLHYDDSSRDDWAVEWFSDPRCTNGYTWLVLDNGTVVELADPGMRTPHAGPCLTPLANSHYYGIAAATNGLVPVTQVQLGSVIALCAALVRHHGWGAGTLGRRIVGHDGQAVWTPRYTRRKQLWGKLGRKADPTGLRTDGVPILSVPQVRARVASQL